MIDNANSMLRTDSSDSTWLKMVQQVHEETRVPTRTLYRYIKRFREGSGQLQGLADNPSGPRIHPNWFTEAEKDLVVDHKKTHRDKSARQIALDLTEAKILSISDHSQSDRCGESHPAGETERVSFAGLL